MLDDAVPISAGPQEALTARIQALAAERPRWIHRLLVREGRPVNRKRVQRLYREAGLAVRRRRKRRRSAIPRPVRAPLTAPNERWSLDFVHDALSTGRRFRCLTIEQKPDIPHDPGPIHVVIDTAWSDYVPDFYDDVTVALRNTGGVGTYYLEFWALPDSPAPVSHSRSVLRRRCRREECEDACKCE